MAAGRSAHFEAILRSEGEPAKEQPPRARIGLGLGVACGLLLVVAALDTLTGHTDKAAKFLTGTGIIKVEEVLQQMIDDNEEQLKPLQKQAGELLAEGKYGDLSVILNTVQLFVSQNKRNKELRQKVEQTQKDLLSGNYSGTDLGIEKIIQDKCTATTMTQIAYLKIDSKTSMDTGDFDRVEKDLKQIKMLWPSCIEVGVGAQALAMAVSENATSIRRA